MSAVASTPAAPLAAPVVAASRPTSGEWAVAAVFGLLTLALFAPWPAPVVDLREACTLTESGRFAVECDLRAAALRARAPWLRQGLRVYESGLLLREARQVAQPRDDDRGTYYTDGATLTFSPLTRGRPNSNGRTYVARPSRWDPLRVTDHRGFAGVLLLAAAGAACVIRCGRAFTQGWPIAAAISGAGIAVQLAAATRSPVHVDAAEVLLSAEAIARGAVPYRSLYYSPYTPLGAYAFSWWGRLWPGGNPPYDWYVAPVIACELACSLLAFRVLVLAGVSRGLAAVAALSLLSMMLWCDGARVLHEPLYLLLVMVSAGWALSPTRRALLPASGALSAVAFFVKQYGGFGLWGLLGYAFAEGKGGLGRALRIAGGFLAGASALLALLLVRGANPLALAGGLAPGVEVTYQTVWFKRFLLQCPIVLPALVVPLLPRAWSRPLVRLAVCFGLASCLPLVFRQHQYYFMNLCPWLFLLFAAGVEHVPASARRFASFAALALLVSIPIRAALGAAQVVEVDNRADQLRRAYLMNVLWPAEKPTLVLVHPGMLFLTRYRSPDESRVGYRFISDMTADRLRVGFERAAGVWVDPQGMYATRPGTSLGADGTSLSEQLATNGFTQQLVLEERFQLWTKEPLAADLLRAVSGVSISPSRP